MHHKEWAYWPKVVIGDNGVRIRNFGSKFVRFKIFEEASMILIEELNRVGTLSDVLRELGWKQAQKQWSPSKIISQEAVGVRMPVAA